MNPDEDIYANALNGKPWWESTTIRGLIASAAMTASTLLSAVLARWLPQDAALLLGMIVALSVLSLLGQLLAWWGRVSSDGRPIDRTAVLPGLSRTVKDTTDNAGV